LFSAFRLSVSGLDTILGRGESSRLRGRLAGEIFGGMSWDIASGATMLCKPAVLIPLLSDLWSATRSAANDSAARGCCRGTATAIESGRGADAGEAFARRRARVSAEFEGGVWSFPAGALLGGGGTKGRACSSHEICSARLLTGPALGGMGAAHSWKAGEYHFAENVHDRWGSGQSNGKTSREV